MSLASQCFAVLAAMLHVAGVLEPGNEERISYVFRLLYGKHLSENAEVVTQFKETLRPCNIFFLPAR